MAEPTIIFESVWNSVTSGWRSPRENATSSEHSLLSSVIRVWPLEGVVIDWIILNGTTGLTFYFERRRWLAAAEISFCLNQDELFMDFSLLKEGFTPRHKMENRANKRVEMFLCKHTLMQIFLIFLKKLQALCSELFLQCQRMHGINRLKRLASWPCGDPLFLYRREPSCSTGTANILDAPQIYWCHHKPHEHHLQG